MATADDDQPAGGEPPDSGGAGPGPGGDAGPPPEEPPSSLGLDDAWEQLTNAGRGIVVGLAALLLVAAAVGIGFGLGGSGGGGGDRELVVSETAGSVVTLEVPPTTADAPETAGIPPETSTEPGQTAGEPSVTPGATTTEDESTAVDPSAGATRVFTDADGPEIGTVSVAVPSEVAWTSEGSTFVLLDQASGATLVDAVDEEGSLALEIGEYDLRVEADGGWTITVRPR